MNWGDGMVVTERKISDIKMYDKNPRNNKGAVPYVAKSIEKFGFKQPIVIDSNGVIVAGHTRYLAAKELGMDTVPCVVADDLSPDEIREYRIADNKTAEQARWNYLGLSREISTIDGEDLIDFGFTTFEINAMKGFDKDIQKTVKQVQNGGSESLDGGVYKPKYNPEFGRNLVSEEDIVKAEIEQDIRFEAKEVKTKKCTCPKCGRIFEVR